MTQTAPRRSCKCELHRSATISDWPSTSVAARAAPSPVALSHPNSIAKESEADVHPVKRLIVTGCKPRCSFSGRYAKSPVLSSSESRDAAFLCQVDLLLSRVMTEIPSGPVRRRCVRDEGHQFRPMRVGGIRLNP